MKLLDEKTVNKFLVAFEERGVSISYEKLKNTIQQISAVTSSRLKTMDTFETRLRFGLKQKEALYLKSIIGDFFYIPYAQFLSEYEVLPSFTKYMSAYHTVSVLNFENLSADEVDFLGRYTANKSLIIYSDVESKNKPKQFQRNWKQINNYFFKRREIELTDLEKEEAVKEKASAEKTKRTKPLSVQLKENPIDRNSLKEFVSCVLKVFNDPRSANLEILQIMSIIPGFDMNFLEKFSNLVESEKIPVFEFIDKYYESFTDKTKIKLLPVLNHLKHVQTNLNKNEANSIMIQLLNFCTITEYDTKSSKLVKNQLMQLHIWLKKLEKSREARIFDNLIECYMENQMEFNNDVKNMVEIKTETAKNTPKAEFKMTPTAQPKLLNGVVNFKVPVSITLDGETKSPRMNLNKEEPILRRSGSAKYKPRPRSWHAGNIFNAARKLR